MRLVERDEIGRLEPRLAAPPPVAAYAPGEGGRSIPSPRPRALVRAAVEAGARLVGDSEVWALAGTDGRVSGVVLPGGAIEADVVVLAAGTDSVALCAGVGVALPVASSPATLSRFSGPAGLVGRVVSGPELEIRQDAAGRLFVADYHVEGESPGRAGPRPRSLSSAAISAAPARSRPSMPGSAGGPCPPTARRLSGSRRMRPASISRSCTRAW